MFREHSLDRPVRLGLGFLMAATLLALPGCDVENPTAITPETADTQLLVEGVRHRWNDAMGVAPYIFVASDEGVAMSSSYQYADDTGDPSQSAAFSQHSYYQMHQARRLAAFAMQRAEAESNPELGLLAQTWHGWTLVRLAEIWGDQPVDGETTTGQELHASALADFEAGAAAGADSTRHRAWAGIARVQFAQGAPSADETRLRAAIDAAQQVLAENPEFLWVEMPNFNGYNYNMGRSYGPSPEFHAIPVWFQGYPQFAGHDSTMVFDSPLKPDGVVVIDADELRLIEAESHLILGELDLAKAAVKRTALLPINHVGVGREPTDPPLTEAEVDALIDPMSEAELLFVVEELRRENQYLYGRRNVGPDGDPIFPAPLHPSA